MDIEGIKGDTEYYDLAAIRSNAAIDLSGANAKVWFTAKLTEDDLDADAIIALNSTDNPTQVVISNPVEGLLYVELVPDDTKDIVQESLVYDVQVREHAGRMTTIQRGELKLVQDITRSTI